MAKRGSIPERFRVTHEARVEGARDAMGVPVVSFAPAVEVRVYGWAVPGTDQATRPEQSGVERDMDLYCREPFAAPNDRVTVQGDVFTAVGWPEQYDYGPFGFTPGCRINLRRVTG